MEILSLDEIKNWRSFEDLMADYFREVKNDKELNIDSVTVLPTGTGSDGGRDILIELLVDDSILSFKRKWVIQCKFYKQDIGKGHLADINIPSLLHEYGADGYLLICRNHYTAPVSKMFEGFNAECPFKRSYLIWNGSTVISRIRFKDKLIDNYFPKHSRHMKLEQKKAEMKLNQI